MSVAFTSDAKARWAAEWLTWPQFGQFWAQVVRHALRKAEAKGTFVQVERNGRKAVVSLDAIEPSGKFLNRAADRADPGRPAAGDPEDRDGPGRAGAIPGRVRHDPARVVPVDVQPDQGFAGAGPADARAGRRLSRRAAAAAGQYRAVAVDRGRVGRAVRRHGPSRSSIAPERTAPRAVPLWPYLATAAVLLFVLDVALRRIDLTLLFQRRRRISLPTRTV